MATPEVEKRVEQFKKDNPGIFSWEIRDKLLNVGSSATNSDPNQDSAEIVSKIQMFRNDRANELWMYSYDKEKLRLACLV